MNLLKGMGYKRLLFLLLGLCILAISLTFFALNISKPYIGLELSKGVQGWIVGAVDATGLAKSHNVNVGDKPVEINNQPAQIFLEKYDKVGIVWGPLISELTVVDNNGNFTEIALEGNSQTIVSITELATWFVVCLAFWLTGFYVFFKKPNNTAALILYFSGLVLGLSFSANMAATRPIPAVPYFAVAASLIGPWLLVHFFLVLPEERTCLKTISECILYTFRQ
jgi:hypothetical protein